MQLFALLLILNIQIYYIFAFPPSLLDLFADGNTSPATLSNDNPKGYECGNFFFSDSEINEALSIAIASVDKGFSFPRRYQGKLYSDSRFTEYLLWPIRKGHRILLETKNPDTTFRIVFTRNSNEVVDVVAKITTSDYTKCIKRDSSRQGPSNSVPESPNGYLCGHRFFSDESVQEYLALAQNKLGEMGKFPAPYVGLLYPKDSGLLIWPMLYKNNVHRSGNGNSGPYYLAMNKEGELVDVFVKGYKSNFLRCIQSRKPPTVPASDPFNKLSMPAPKSGYQCGRYFFDDNVLQENAEIAKNNAAYTVKGKYPKEHNGDPFNEPCLIWPILKDGSLFKKGNKGPYRFFLTLDYKVKSVASVVEGKLEVCERRTIVGKKYHDTSDYLCSMRRYSHIQLVEAAENACEKLNNRSFYPAKYEGPRFKMDGPYFTYPVLQHGPYEQKQIGPDRVVINLNCEVVGALTTVKGRFHK
ncbi:hypothetical protein EPUL_005220, partial [Erysiphe pulchra]